ncbi:OmpA family protein [uncultured Aquabacterium sp.]|uniref:OmpA family protein n=1 Tax=Aquabacterium sp. TaxID=1872578 RepID=UPI0025FBF5C5|nr:OmpA family protein [uncultured Aquabacterium sp.]
MVSRFTPARRHVRQAILLVLTALGGASVGAQAVPDAGSSAGVSTAPVVVSGTVPDEATRVAILTRMRELYGASRVVDQLSLGTVVAPAQWRDYVQKLLSPHLRQVSHGQLAVQGQVVEIRGEVPNEAVRQQLASDMAQALNPTYTVRNGLRVAVQDQSVVDQALANRIVEFEPGSAVLRPASLPLLDEMAAAMARLKDRRFEVIGHTDADGARAANVSLSLARAQAVKTYLIGKGLPPDRIAISGMGPDQPVASNATEAGRARNRRIEFRVGS